MILKKIVRVNTNKIFITDIYGAYSNYEKQLTLYEIERSGHRWLLQIAKEVDDE